VLQLTRSKEERGGFTGIFEIVAADKARVGRMKRRPFCAGNVDWRPYQPSPPLLPNQPSHPCLTQGRIEALRYLASDAVQPESSKYNHQLHTPKTQSLPYNHG
jgi:hypothetical protein